MLSLKIESHAAFSCCALIKAFNEHFFILFFMNITIYEILEKLKITNFSIAHVLLISHVYNFENANK
jgi:hypothetical protein